MLYYMILYYIISCLYKYDMAPSISPLLKKLVQYPFMTDLIDECPKEASKAYMEIQCEVPQR